MGHQLAPTPKPDDVINVDGVLFSFSAIHGVVDTFYQQVAADPMLKVPFSTVKDWPYHIERLTHFWWIRLGGRPYQAGMYNPVEKHFLAGYNQEFLDQWLKLFHGVLGAQLSERQAAIWAEISQHMGQALLWKNEQYTQFNKQ